MSTRRIVTPGRSARLRDPLLKRGYRRLNSGLVRLHLGHTFTCESQQDQHNGTLGIARKIEKDDTVNSWAEMRRLRRFLAQLGPGW
jgi:hypothetical protein